MRGCQAPGPAPAARAADALLEASVIGSYSRIGISVRSRLLPEFTRDIRPPSAGREWARRAGPAEVAFHAMHPGWAATPGITAALPGFSRLMRPLLRSPHQGADTIVWLATAPAGYLGSGCFWHDRRPRPEYPLPWTREPDPAAATRLWELVAQATRS